MCKDGVTPFGRPPDIGHNESMVLQSLILSGMVGTDQQYRNLLARHTGTSKTVSCVRKHMQKNLKSNLKSKVVDVTLHEMDKFTPANYLKHREFCLSIEKVKDRRRLKAYDQTGTNGTDLVNTTQRTLDGFLPHNNRKTPNGDHLSIFGLANGLQLEHPPMYFRTYKADRDNKQGTDEHVDFWENALDDNVLEPDYDVIVMDNWAAHTSERGQALEDMLFEDHGIVVLHPAARFSHLNWSEHSWRRSKGFARTVISHNFLSDGRMMGKLVVKGLERLTHLDIMTDMMGDGYGIHKRHQKAIFRNSYSSGPYVHCYNNI